MSVHAGHPPKPGVLPVADTNHMNSAALGLMVEATSQQTRAVLKLQELFARHGGELSTHVLTPTSTTKEVYELSETHSFAVLNFSPIVVQLGMGGRQPIAPWGIPVPPMSWLQLPLETNEAELGARAIDTEAAGGSAMVCFVRYRHLMATGAGPLGGVAMAGAVTPASPGHATATASSELVLPANLSRRGLSIQNNGAKNVSIGLGAAAVVGSDIVLEPGASWDGRLSSVLWTGSVALISAEGEQSCAVVEV